MSNEIKSVFGVVFSEDHQFVLLIKRSDLSVWAFPGGGVENGESGEEACLREIQEETGFLCKIIKKVHDYDQSAIKAILYECKIISGERKISSETKEVRFFPVSALPDPFPPFFKEMINHALYPPSNGNYSLKYLRGFLRFFVRFPSICLRFVFLKIASGGKSSR